MVVTVITQKNTGLKTLSKKRKEKQNDERAIFWVLFGTKDIIA